MPRVNADYIDLTASLGYSTQPLPRNRRLPELGLWPAVGEGRPCVGRRAQPQQHRRIRRGHRLPQRLRLREHLLRQRRHSAAGQREGLIVRIGRRQRGSCRAVEQSLPLRTAAPASAGSERAASACHGQRSGRLLVHGPPVPDLWTGRRVDPDERAEQPVAVGWRPAHHLQGRSAQRFHRHLSERVVQPYVVRTDDRRIQGWRVPHGVRKPPAQTRRSSILP